MRRIVVIASGLAGTACAVKTKRRLPDHEINLVLPAGLEESAKGDGPFCKRLARQLPSGDLRSSREVGVLAVTDIQPDFARREITVTSERGALNVRYSTLVLEVPAQSAAPRAVQNAGNVFSLPADGFFAQAPACDAALLRAAKTSEPILVVGGGVPGLDAVLAALEAGCRVIWVQPKTMGEPTLEPHLERYITRILGDAVEAHRLPDTPERELQFLLTDDGAVCTGIVLPEKGPVAAACCLWAGQNRARHPILREDGFHLDLNGRIRIDSEAEEALGVHLTGSGAAGAPLILGCGAPAPMYAGGGETAMAMAARSTERLCGSDAPFPGLAGVRRARGGNLTVCRAGYTMAEAEAAGIPAEHAVYAHNPAEGRDPLILSLICCTRTRTLLGAQAVGRNLPAESVEGLFDAALSALAEGTTLDNLILRDWGGLPGKMIGRCASMLRHKLEGPVKGITPDELLASFAAGAEFFLLDLRPERDWLRERLPESHNIPLAQLTKRLQSEVPRMTPLVLVAEDSGDAYAVAVRLAGLGATELYVLDGGMKLWPYEPAR